MRSYKNENADWSSYMKEEHSLEEYLEKFNCKLTREGITNQVKDIMLESYKADLVS
jgi:hypothetical protein